MHKFVIILFFIYLISGFSKVIAQQEQSCYLAVSINNNQTSLQESEEAYREVVISLMTLIMTIV